MKCQAHRSNGSTCSSWAIKGSNVCRVHGGSAPQVKRAARERIAAAADDAAAELVSLVMSAESESVKLAAIRDLLDRAGYGAKQKIEQDVTVHGDADLDREITALVDKLATRGESGAPVAPDGTTQPGPARR